MDYTMDNPVTGGIGGMKDNMEDISTICSFLFKYSYPLSNDELRMYDKSTQTPSQWMQAVLMRRNKLMHQLH